MLCTIPCAFGQDLVYSGITQLSSKFQTLENQFEQGSGRFVDPEAAFQSGTTNSSRTKKNKNTKNKKSSMKPNVSFCRKEFLSAERSLFGTKKVVLIFDGIGGKKKNERKPQIADVQKNTTKQGVLLIFVLVIRYSFVTQNNITTKQNNIHK